MSGTSYRAPRRLLLNDEGSAALHHLDLDVPERCWSVSGPGRDLQLIGAGLVLRSTPRGYVELSLEDGRLVREVSLPGLPGIESARRLPSGHTVLLGNGPNGIRLSELDASGRPVAGRVLECDGLLKGRLLRRNRAGQWLFCSDTDGRRAVHAADFDAGVRELFRVPSGVAADSMVKAVATAPNRLLVSSGYAASLLVIDTDRCAVVQTIGGKGGAEPGHFKRSLSLSFFSGFQIMPGGNLLVANWQGHGPSHAREGYQVLLFAPSGELLWAFDQTEYPSMTSLNNVLVLDGLDASLLHDELEGALTPL